MREAVNTGCYVYFHIKSSNTNYTNLLIKKHCSSLQISNTPKYTGVLSCWLIQLGILRAAIVKTSPTNDIENDTATFTFIL